MKLMRQLQTGVDECEVPSVFVLKRTRPLTLSSEQNINKYAFEIGEIIKYLTIEAEYEVSILTHEEGAFLTLTYFTRRAINVLFTNIVERIRSIVLVDTTQPFIRIMHDPPHRSYLRLQQEIFTDRQRVSIFNKMKIVVINTYKEDERLTHFQFPLGKEQFVFANTALISSREMANVHYYLPPNSLSFPPFVRRIGQFISKDLAQSMSITQIHDYFRHGQSYSYEAIEKSMLQDCRSIQLKPDSGRHGSLPCLELKPVRVNASEAVIIYSPHHFQMFTSSFQRIYPFDNLTEGSIFILQTLDTPAYILNPKKQYIFVTRQFLVTPKNPLPFPSQQLFATSQLIFSNYSAVSVCPNLLLLFPAHFAQGNAQRKFLTSGQGECFSEDSILQQFSWQFFLHWSLFRNIIIFTLLCTEYRKQYLSERMIEQFLINFLLLIGREEVDNKFFYTLYIVSFGLMVEYAARILLQLKSKVRIPDKWTNSFLLCISAICLVGSALNLFNVWGIFLFSMIFFVNEQSILVVILKLYFIKEEIWHNGTHYGLSELGLLTMWIYTALPSNKVTSEAVWTAQRLFSGLLMAGSALSLESSGNFVNNLVTIYMKVLIVVKMLRIIRK